MFTPDEQKLIDRVGAWFSPQNKRTVSYFNPFSSGYDPQKWQDFKVYNDLLRRMYPQNDSAGGLSRPPCL